MRGTLSPRTLVVVALIAVIAAGVVGGGVLGVRHPAPAGDPTASPDSSGTRPPEDVLDTGEVALLDDMGGRARVNGVRPDPEVPRGAPLPYAGTHLMRLDVEMCAGTAEITIDPAAWLGVGAEGQIHSGHLGVRDLLGVTLAPGGCQRGGVDVVVPDGGSVDQVLLMDEDRATIARWLTGGEPGVQEPLTATVEAHRAQHGEAVPLPGGGSVTLGALSGGRLDVQLCAGRQPLATTARHWLLHLPDNRLIPAATADDDDAPHIVTAGDCHDLTIPITASAEEVTDVVYVLGGALEVARWTAG